MKVCLPAVAILLSSLTIASFSCCIHQAEALSNETTTLTPITIRGGVLLAPPFALIDESHTPSFQGDTRYTGFQGDLLRYLSDFAKEDGYNLNFNLSLSPYQNYGKDLDVIANDCNTTYNPLPLEECDAYDVIVGDYYVNAERSMRIDFSPAWQRSGMSSIKLIEPEVGKQDFVTLSQLEGAGGTACVPSGTYLATVVMAKFPRLSYLQCDGPDECIAHVRSRDCALYVDDELALKYRALSDERMELEVTGETFSTQYLVWPMSYRLEEETRTLLKKWLYSAVANATLDELDYKYFSPKTCDLGTAGENCERYCDPKRGRADRKGNCICHSMKWTGADCSVEVLEDYNLYPNWLQALCYVLFALQAILCISCGVWMYKKRKSRQVQAAQPMFLNLVLFGCMLSTSSILVTAQQAAPESDDLPPCALFPWLYTLGFSITFGTLFTKIWRVWKLFRGAVELQRVVITPKYTLSVILTITSVDFIICLVWTIVDPLTWQRTVIREDKFGEPLESVAKCTSDHWSAFIWTIAVWHLCISAMACIICYLSRNIPSKYNEGKALSAVIASNMQILLLSIPILIIVGNDPVPSLFVRAVVIWLNDFVVVAIIFGKLIRSVHSTSEKDNDMSVGEAVRRFKARESNTPEVIDSVSILKKSIHDRRKSTIYSNRDDFLDNQLADGTSAFHSTNDASDDKKVEVAKSDGLEEEDETENDRKINFQSAREKNVTFSPSTGNLVSKS